MQTNNVVEAVRSRLGAALGRGRTAPAEAGAVAPKRTRRLIVLALAATLAALPISAAVQTVGAPKAQAAVDDRASWVYPATAAMTAFNFWRNSVNWPATGFQNNQYNTGQGWVNGGGFYNDNDSQLRNWIHRTTGNWGQTLNFREYDGATRANPWTNRGAERYVYNVEYGVIFHTTDHYANFSPLNFGNLPTPWFGQTVHCYEFGPGQANGRRISLYNGRSNPIAYTVNGLPGSGMSVVYHRMEEFWNGGNYQPANGGWDQGFSIPAWPSFMMHQDPNAICRHWTGFWNGTW